MYRILIAIILLCLSNLSHGVTRISQYHHNLGEVERVYMAAGLASLFVFPFSIQDIVIGNPKDYVVKILRNKGKEMTVLLTNGGALPSNLVVKSGGKHYVFDLSPSKTNHQDVIKISGRYGGPTLSGNSIKTIESSSNKLSVKTTKRKIVASSSRKSRKRVKK